MKKMCSKEVISYPVPARAFLCWRESSGNEGAAILGDFRRGSKAKEAYLGASAKRKVSAQ